MLKILNGNPGFGVPFNEEETVKFLTTGKLNLHLGTVNEKGHPNVHPVWYYYDTGNYRIYIETSKQSKKRNNLRNNTIVYFCIDDPNVPRGVRGEGDVKIHEDINFNIPIAEKIMIKYLGNTEHPIAQTLLNMQKGGQSVVLELFPKYYSTWDLAKQ